MMNLLVLPAAAILAQQVASMYYIRTIVYSLTRRIPGALLPIRAARRVRRGAVQARIAQAVMSITLSLSNINHDQGPLKST